MGNDTYDAYQSGSSTSMLGQDPSLRTLNEKIKYSCNNCHSQFAAKRSLLKHLKNECFLDMRFKCLYCEVTCRFRAEVYSHIRLQHPGKKIVCLDLNMFPNNIDCYSTTTTTTPQPQNFKCSTCSKSYQVKRSLWRHEKYECGQLPRFGCPYCSYRGKWAPNVYAHIRGIHKNRPVAYIDLHNKK